MKKLMMSLALVSLAAGAACAFQNEDPKGYEGHAWGSQPTETMRLAQRDLLDPTTTWYTESIDRVEKGGVEFNAPLYGFDEKWGLYTVVLKRPEVTSTGDELTDPKLEAYLEETHDKADEDSMRYMVRTRVWRSEHYPITELRPFRTIDDWDVEWEFDHKWQVLIDNYGVDRELEEGTNLTWNWGLGSNNLIYSSNTIEALRELRAELEAAKARHDAEMIEHGKAVAQQ